jgi:hypothetical protein
MLCTFFPREKHIFSRIYKETEFPQKKLWKIDFRLGKFSPFGQLFTLAVTLKLQMYPKFWLLFSLVKVVMSTNWIWLHFYVGDFFTYSSGHPAFIPCSMYICMYLCMCGEEKDFSEPSQNSVSWRFNRGFLVSVEHLKNWINVECTVAFRSDFLVEFECSMYGCLSVRLSGRVWGF